ncbi:hypothetical protein PtB15_10B516 [Puccinia triticina]|nr:hypothetical protein PtB15_10B516 [Puccinia triticina]
MPNFDGQFTRYFERSPVSTPDQECDEPHYFDHPYTWYDSSPDSVLSPLRSRATSIALKKLMETQMQMLLDISAAWKKNATQPASFLPANPIFPSAQLPRKIRSMSQKSSVSLASSSTGSRSEIKTTPASPQTLPEAWPQARRLQTEPSLMLEADLFNCIISCSPSTIPKATNTVH